MLILEVALLGLFTTSSNVVGAALGLYLPLPKKILAGILAFAAGSLIASLAIELGFEGAESLREHGASLHVAWAEIAGGFAAGAILYYVASLFLEQNGAAIRYPSRFLEYARDRKRKELVDRLAQLSKSQLLRHLPSEAIEPLLEKVQDRQATAGEIVIRHGDPGDSLYIVATGELEVLDDQNHGLAKLGPGETFGEMALLTGGTRTATVRANVDSLLLRLSKEDFDALIANDAYLAKQVLRMSHERAVNNLRRRDVNPAVWAKAARDSVDSVSRSEESRLLLEAKAGRGAGLAIVFGNILDTIPGCLVIGAKFTGYESLSATLIIGMFLGGIPEAARQRRHAAPRRLQQPHDLPAVVERAGRRRRGVRRRALVHRRGERRSGIGPGGGGRRHPGAGHPCDDPRSLAQGRFGHRAAGRGRLPDGALPGNAGGRQRGMTTLAGPRASRPAHALPDRRRLAAAS